MTNIGTIAAVRNKAPWIGVGCSGNWSVVEDAMDACGLNFEVRPKNVQFSYDEDNLTYYETIPGFKAMVRTDSNKALGCVSDTYQLVQNHEIFSMLEPFVNAGGHIVAGGMTNQGLCFMVAEMEVSNIGGDDYAINIMATNSFNGRFPASLICTPVRIICQNMYRQLMNKADNVARFRHSLNISGRLNAIKSAYEMFLDYKDGFSNHINVLKSSQAKHSIDEVVELMFPYSEVDPDSPRYESSRERVDERRAYYINHYYNSDTNSDFGSCFALVNAYYDYISHDVPVRKTEEEYKDSRLSKIVGGTMVKPKLMSFMCEPK